MDENRKEKRNFSRVPFDCEAIIASDGQEYLTHLLDVCINGALVKRPDEWHPDKGSLCQLTLRLPDGETQIQMQPSTVAHCETDRVGVKCGVFDIDSITQLRRLVELNLGDPELVHRELAQLGQSMSQTDEPAQ